MKYIKNCKNCGFGGCGNIINNSQTSFCRHPWGETDPDRLHLYTDKFVRDEFERERQPEGVLCEELAEEIDCPHHEWNMYHPAKQDHQMELL